MMQWADICRIWQRERAKKNERDAARLFRMQMEIGALHRWCADIPEVEAVCEWLMDSDAAWIGKPIPAERFGKWPRDISKFRERLREIQASRPEGAGHV